MGNLGLVAIIPILGAMVPYLLMLAGGVLGIIAFQKVRRMEAALREKGIL